MLESTGDVPQCSSKTMFGIITKFDPVQGRVIQTEHFLQACKELTNILDCLGTSFLLAKKDIMGNIKKIEEQFQTRPMFYTTLNVILEEESHVKIKPSNLSLAIIWLNRALQFIRAFTSGLSREHRNKVAEENLRTTILQAYEGTLRPYHGAMTQFLFSNIARLVPCRKSFHRALMMDKTASVDMVISDIDLYLPTFSDTLDLLEELLNEFELTSAEVV